MNRYEVTAFIVAYAETEEDARTQVRELCNDIAKSNGAYVVAEGVLEMVEVEEDV